MLSIQGEELRKQIGAAAYIECSSKTQQVELEPKVLGLFHMYNLFKVQFMNPKLLNSIKFLLDKDY